MLRRSGVIYAALLCTSLIVPSAAASSAIAKVTLSRGFFSPSLDQNVTLAIALSKPGKLHVLVLDRDGIPVRNLAKKTVRRGTVKLQWDGRDDAGVPVPDEAWSFKIDLASAKGTDTYFPAAAAPVEMISIRPESYARAGGILRYTLPGPSRVHMQAGNAVVDEKRGTIEGPVLKTIVNREPRTGGAVIEQWNGRDESGTIYVPDLPHFVIGIATTPLPENSVITTGNRKTTYLTWAAQRHRKSVLPHHKGDHSHHAGLTAAEDTSPALALALENAQRRGNEWTTEAPMLRVRATVQGPAAQAFIKHTGTITAFIDDRELVTVTPEGTEAEIQVPLSGVAPGPHVLALNWKSPFGPVAANAVVVNVVRTAEGGGR